MPDPPAPTASLRDRDPATGSPIRDVDAEARALDYLCNFGWFGIQGAGGLATTLSDVLNQCDETYGRESGWEQRFLFVVQEMSAEIQRRGPPPSDWVVLTAAEEYMRVGRYPSYRLRGRWGRLRDELHQVELAEGGGGANGERLAAKVKRSRTGSPIVQVEAETDQ